MHTFSFAQPKAKLYISRNFSGQSKTMNIFQGAYQNIAGDNL